MHREGDTPGALVYLHSRPTPRPVWMSLPWLSTQSQRLLLFSIQWVTTQTRNWLSPPESTSVSIGVSSSSSSPLGSDDMQPGSFVVYAADPLDIGKMVIVRAENNGMLLCEAIHSDSHGRYYCDQFHPQELELFEVWEQQVA
jgi:hypothetical protein